MRKAGLLSVSMKLGFFVDNHIAWVVEVLGGRATRTLVTLEVTLATDKIVPLIREDVGLSDLAAALIFQKLLFVRVRVDYVWLKAKHVWIMKPLQFLISQGLVTLWGANLKLCLRLEQIISLGNVFLPMQMLLNIYKIKRRLELTELCLRESCWELEALAFCPPSYLLA